MHHKYSTRAIVLARRPLAEANILLVLLTDLLGLVMVRAQGLRKGSSKLAHALQTLSESNIMLVRGREGWRLTGAILQEAHAGKMTAAARARAARTAELLFRLVGGESHDEAFFSVYRAFIEALPSLSEEQAEVAEILAALRILSALGLDAAEPEGTLTEYTPETLARALTKRTELIARINRGIAASGL